MSSNNWNRQALQNISMAGNQCPHQGQVLLSQQRWISIYVACYCSVLEKRNIPEALMEILFKSPIYLKTIYIFSMFPLYDESALYGDVIRRRIEIPFCTRNFKANHSLKLHNVHFKIASSISGSVFVKLSLYSLLYAILNSWKGMFHILVCKTRKNKWSLATCLLNGTPKSNGTPRPSHPLKLPYIYIHTTPHPRPPEPLKLGSPQTLDSQSI